jgi:dTDP-glucose 4,6-dehydratase
VKRILVTGGAGFIGSALVRELLQNAEYFVITIDKMTYAASAGALADLGAHPRHCFEKIDICDSSALTRAFAQHLPDAVMHLAAETHVDRSIDDPEQFVQTNVVGTLRLIEAVRQHFGALDRSRRAGFRFLHVSTDEVFGSLGSDGRFSESTPYQPRSPYSASKAAADHIVRAWHETYGLPVIVTNCSNNYGPYQFPEKLIPLSILSARMGKGIPVYGDGANVRDWLYVEDHARALRLVLEAGRTGETYNIGANNERTNIEVVTAICEILDRLRPEGAPHGQLITHVADRPGHDRRYAIDATKIRRELGWRPYETFQTGLQKTVEWCLSNEARWPSLWVGRHSDKRFGAAA